MIDSQRPRPPTIDATEPDCRQQVVLLTIALAPIALLVFLLVAAPTFLASLTDERINIRGIPLGHVFVVMIAFMTIASVEVAGTCVRSLLPRWRSWRSQHSRCGS